MEMQFPISEHELFELLKNLLELIKTNANAIITGIVSIVGTIIVFNKREAKEEKIRDKEFISYVANLLSRVTEHKCYLERIGAELKNISCGSEKCSQIIDTKYIITFPFPEEVKKNDNYGMLHPIFFDICDRYHRLVNLSIAWHKIAVDNIDGDGAKDEYLECVNKLSVYHLEAQSLCEKMRKELLAEIEALRRHSKAFDQKKDAIITRKCKK